MANFPKFHGITLAANAWIENVVVERLVTDPVPLSAGRIWYNSISKELKFSSLDAGGAVIVEVVATGAQVADALTQLSALGARVSAVEADYIKKDGSVAFTGDVNAGNHKLLNVADGVASTDAVNLGQVNAKIAALGNAFDYVGTVDGGATSGAAFDMNTLTAKTPGKYYKVTTAGYFKVGAAGTPFYANVNDGLVFNTTAGVDVVDNTNSTVSGTAGYIAVTGTSDTGYVVDLDTAIKTAISDNTAAIAAEVTRAQAAESTLTTNLAAEVTRAQAAEGELSTRVGSLSSLTTTDKTDIVSAINEVKTAAGGGTDALRGKINAQRFRFLAGAAALQHTIAHNLNSSFVDVTVWVKADDGLFYNDICSVAETNANTLVVSLTESRIVKVVVQDMNDIAA